MKKYMVIFTIAGNVCSWLTPPCLGQMSALELALKHNPHADTILAVNHWPAHAG